MDLFGGPHPAYGRAMIRATSARPDPQRRDPGRPVPPRRTAHPAPPFGPRCVPRPPRCRRRGTVGGRAGAHPPRPRRARPVRDVLDPPRRTLGDRTDVVDGTHRPHHPRWVLLPTQRGPRRAAHRARIRGHPPRRRRARRRRAAAAAMGNHAAVVVHSLPTEANPGGRWYVDAGLGDVLHEPLPLRAWRGIGRPRQLRTGTRERRRRALAPRRPLAGRCRRGHRRRPPNGDRRRSGRATCSTPRRASRRSPAR